MRFSMLRVIDSELVPGLYQPVSVALDARGNLLICDTYREGEPTLSRLVIADDYTRVVLGTEASLGVTPQTVRIGPRDTLYVAGYRAGEQEIPSYQAVRLSGYNRLEQVYTFPTGSIPDDLCIDQNGKL